VNRKNTEESQNKFYIIGQEDKHQSDVTWWHGKKIRPSLP
jgi:hypothetical protein